MSTFKKVTTKNKRQSQIILQFYLKNIYNPILFSEQ